MYNIRCCFDKIHFGMSVVLWKWLKFLAAFLTTSLYEHNLFVSCNKARDTKVGMNYKMARTMRNWHKMQPRLPLK